MFLLGFLDRTKYNHAQFLQGIGKCTGVLLRQSLKPYVTLRVLDIPDPFCHTVNGRFRHSGNIPHRWFIVGSHCPTLSQAFSPGSFGSHFRPVTKQRLGSKACSNDIGYFLVGRKSGVSYMLETDNTFKTHSHSNLPNQPVNFNCLPVTLSN